MVALHRLALALPVRDNRRYKLVLKYHGPIGAPFNKGAEVEQLVAKFRDGTEQTMPLVAVQSASKAAFFWRVWSGLKSLVGA